MCATFHIFILYWSFSPESGNKKEALQSFMVLLWVSWSTREGNWIHAQALTGCHTFINYCTQRQKSLKLVAAINSNLKVHIIIHTE